MLNHLKVIGNRNLYNPGRIQTVQYNFCPPKFFKHSITFPQVNNSHWITLQEIEGQ